MSSGFLSASFTRVVSLVAWIPASMSIGALFSHGALVVVKALADLLSCCCTSKPGPVEDWSSL